MLECLVAVSWCVLVCSGNVLTVSLNAQRPECPGSCYCPGYWMLGVGTPSHTVTAWDREYSVLRVGSQSIVPSLHSAPRTVRPNPLDVIVTVDSTIFVIVEAEIVVRAH